MRLLVIGATKGIGALAVTRALDEGHEVRALSRTPASGPERPDLETVTGDATKTEDLAPALDGMDAVIVTLGLGRDLRKVIRKTTLFSDTARALLPLMEDKGPKRLLVVTGFGAGDSINAMSSIERMGHRLLLGRAYADKDVQEEMIRSSGLDWTIVRPTILNDNKGTSRYKEIADPAKWRNGVISRADVAHYLVRAAAEGLHIREAVVITR